MQDKGEIYQCENTCNIRARPGGMRRQHGRGASRRHRSGGGGGGIGAAAAAAADVKEAAGGAGCSLTAAADALGAAGGEGVSHTAADAGNTRKNMRKYTQKYKNIKNAKKHDI